MFVEDTFSSGLRLITVPRTDTRVVTSLILVGSGSRYETSAERGIAHFLEHMFFKGGKRYPTPKSVAGTIDSIGADFNAFTAKEYAGYYVNGAAEHLPIALDVLSDMLLNTKLAQEDIERERGVILEELNMYLDAPSHQIGWDFEHLLFGDTPMGRDQIGLPETITSFDEADFKKYRHDLYTADNTVIVLSGAITPELAKKRVNEFFEFDTRKKSRTALPFDGYRHQRQVHVREKKTEQAHVMLGFPALTYHDSNRYVGRVLSTILGGNMSSRLFSTVREEMGLCYSISSGLASYTDVGTLTIHAGVDLKRLQKALVAIGQQCRIVREMGVAKEEVAHAIGYLKGQLALSMEDSEELAALAGVQSMLGVKQLKTLEDIIHQIEQVTPEQVNTLAKQIFDPAKVALSLIGPFAQQEQQLLAALQENL